MRGDKGEESIQAHGHSASNKIKGGGKGRRPLCGLCLLERGNLAGTTAKARGGSGVAAGEAGKLMLGVTGGS